MSNPKPTTWTALSASVVALCFLINMLDGVNVVLVSYAAPYISKDWHLASTSMGAVFSASLVGMGVGGFFIAPLADRLGRRRMILIAVLVMAAAMALGGFAPSLIPLMISRVMAGLGIGTVLACMAALVAEFAPPAHRSFAVGIVQGGYPIGAVITGFICASALPQFGWHTAFIAAGLASLLILPLLFIMMPESGEFLGLAQQTTAAPPPSPQLRHDTWLLWAAFFSGFMVLYFIVSWIPKLCIEAGLDPRNAIYAGATYNIGAFLGTAAMSWLAGKLGLKRLITALLATAAVALLLFGSLHVPVIWVLALALLIGITLQGGFNGLYPLAAHIYPTAIRSTGIGRAVGVGRIGAVIGPLLGGYILTLNLGLAALFATFAAALLITLSCVAMLTRPPAA